MSSASAATCENTSAALLVVSSHRHCMLRVWRMAALGRVKQKKRSLLLIESNWVWRLQVHCSPAKGEWAVVSDGAPELTGRLHWSGRKNTHDLSHSCSASVS